MPHRSILLRRVQDLLSRIYDVRLEHDVNDFLVTDRMQLAPVTEEGVHPHIEEELLVRQEGDTVKLSLYLDGEVLERLGRRDPLAALDAGNVADYWTVLEGVSHFLYLTWNASFNRPVSVLELEVQAEVDKYATTLFLLGSQQSGRFPVHLHRWLFERARVDHSLEPRKFALYASANHYAARFCRKLERRFLRRGRVRCEALIRELRHFYRLTQAPKIRHIERS
jgi:hypothetical protein